jgi:Skp family chaperone for outer membrane proteins
MEVCIFLSTPRVITRKKEWISSSAWEKTEESRRLKAELCAGHSFNTRRRCELQEKYKSLNKDVKVNARRDHREFLDSLAQEAQETAKKRGI